MSDISVRSPARTRHVILGVTTWLSTLETVYRSLCISDKTIKAVGFFYLVSMLGEVKDPSQWVNV